MTTNQFRTTAWTWNPAFLLFCALSLVGYFLAFRLRGRPIYLGAALIIFVVALMSPLNALANGYLFSAHMVQHILLVLIIPAFFLLSLPRSFSLPAQLKPLLIRSSVGLRALARCGFGTHPLSATRQRH